MNGQGAFSVTKRYLNVDRGLCSFCNERPVKYECICGSMVIDCCESNDCISAASREVQSSMTSVNTNLQKPL